MLDGVWWGFCSVCYGVMCLYCVIVGVLIWLFLLLYYVFCVVCCVGLFIFVYRGSVICMKFFSMLCGLLLFSSMMMVLWVFGLICDILMSYVFGVNVVIDVFVIVFCIFNFMWCLFVEGLFFIVFVLVFIEVK